MNYEEAANRTWSPMDGTLSDEAARLRELVRYATLAPSSHNTQCWRFRIEQSGISILPDPSRRCPVVDPDDHHLYVSLGCAAENLFHAARAQGFSAEMTFDALLDAVRVVLEPAVAEVTPLFEAIPRRQCTRTEYNGDPLTATELALLESAGTGNGVRAVILTAQPAMETVLEHVLRGNTAQMTDRAFVRELKSWIRFSDGEAVRAGDGLAGRTTGSPSVPRWLGSQLFRFVFRVRSENEKCARQLRSSAGIAVFVSDANDKAHWVEAGRCYERFALQATSMNIRTAFLNQPVEDEERRSAFATALGLTPRRPDLVVRFGRGSEMPRSLRRPLEAVLIDA